jgi:hypothetical protein
VSGGKTHTKQLVTGRMYIHGLFSHTFEVATYTKLPLTTGSWKHGRIKSIIYIGTGGEAVCVTAVRKKDGGCNC